MPNHKTVEGQMEELMQEFKKKAGKGVILNDGFLGDEVNFSGVLFILKESHNEECKESGFWMKKVFDNEGEKDPKHYKEKIIAMNQKIAEIDKNIAKDKLPAYINLNKFGGGSHTEHIKLAEIALYYKDLLKKQIKLVKPKYIICCGCFDEYVKCVEKGLKKCDRTRWRKDCKNGIFINEDEKKVISMLHLTPGGNKVFNNVRTPKQYANEIGERITRAYNLEV